MEEFDCVVVGAGWYGLAAARQFHHTHPGSSLAVYDSQSSLGGTWAEERLYPGLKSNNLLGTYEYPDFPMTSDRFDVQTGKHISGRAIHEYLKAYADHFDIGHLIHLNTKVVVAEHQDTEAGGWILTLAPAGGSDENKSEDGSSKKVLAKRLILATGLTSEPFLPHFDGQEEFGGKVFHGKHFLQNSDTLKTAKAVTVFGATKFGWDAVYAYATAGVKVNWVIRSSGHGPCWIAPTHVTPLKKWIEKLANLRPLTWFSPCIWGDADGYSTIRNFYHGTALGRLIVDSFWKVLGGDVMALNKYDAHPDTAKLKPWTSAMFTGASFSLLNYDEDIFELVRGPLVDVHVGEIDHLSKGKVHLADGTSFDSDVLLANTGWKHVPPVKLLPEGIERELGIPHKWTESTSNTSSEAVEDLANRHDLMSRADEEILRRFPRLRRQPVWNKNYVPMTEQKGISARDEDEVTPYKPLTPYMLHHFIVPASERFLRLRDTAFAGVMSNFSNSVMAHVGGLWISAFFSGDLDNDPAAVLKDEKGEELRRLQYETVLFNRWGKWRYPTDWGNKNPNFIFDSVPYLDLLMRDLGLNQYRKGGWLGELTDAYSTQDYKGINEEWEKKMAAKRGSRKKDE
ncbi:FAD/NAD(P)-binding domain-containing protein [Xylariaceae sp. FL0594]|nr:FAD/NAD(P)-binding domain-containing protein [Xylariaceae sp. FL0594]